MNYPTKEQIEEFSKSYSDPIFVIHICQSFIDVVREVNPEPELVWPDGANYVAMDNSKEIYWYDCELDPYDEVDGCWWSREGEMGKLNFIEYPALYTHCVEQFMNKPASECLIERVR